MSHSNYPMSGSYVWREDHCPASIRMRQRYHNEYQHLHLDAENTYQAQEGTAAHDMREFCLNLGVNPIDCLGMKFNNIEVDEWMVEGVTIDVNYVNRLSIEYGVKPLIEQRVVMDIHGRTDIFGTADTTFIVPKKRLVHSIDFKYGRVPVQVEDNSQLGAYGVATLDTFKLWGSIDTVKTSIVQPRYQHVDGPIRTCGYSNDSMFRIAEMFERSVKLADNPETKPNAGSWCHYCPARANCRARMLRTLDVSYRAKSLNDISNEELELLILEVPSAKSHLEHLESEVRKRALSGTRFDNFKIVESRPRKKCNDEKRLAIAVNAAGINTDRLYDKKLKSHSGVSKVVPKSIVDKFYVRPPTCDVIAPMSDKRVAKVIGSVPKGVFGKITK